MNTDAKYSIKYWQTESKNTSKNHLPLASRLHSGDAGLVKHTEICLCNLPYKQTERKSPYMIISLDAEKVIDKIQHLFKIKVLEK